MFEHFLWESVFSSVASMVHQRVEKTATATESLSASELWSCSCHREKKKSSFSDRVTCFSCDQYLIILILLAAPACLLSYLSTHGGMPALSFLLAVYFSQSVSKWRHLDADQHRCRDGEARASDPTCSHLWPWCWSPSCSLILRTGLVKTAMLMLSSCKRYWIQQMRKCGLPI